MCTAAFRDNFYDKHRRIIALGDHQTKDLAVCANGNADSCLQLRDQLLDLGITQIVILHFLSSDNKLTGFRSVKCNVGFSFYIFHTRYAAGITQYDFQICTIGKTEIVHLLSNFSHITDINGDTTKSGFARLSFAAVLASAVHIVVSVGIGFTLGGTTDRAGLGGGAGGGVPGFVGAGRSFHRQDNTAGRGADFTEHCTGLTGHTDQIFAGFQITGIQHNFAAVIHFTDYGPLSDNGRHIIHGRIIDNRRFTGRHIHHRGLCGIVAGSHIGTGNVDAHGHFIALGYGGVHHIISNANVVEDAVRIGIEIPAGEIAQHDHVAVFQQNLVGSGTPAIRGQRVLIVDIIVQVAIAAPELIQERRTSAAADGKHVRANQSFIIKITLTGIFFINAAIEAFQRINVQMQQGHLPLRILRGTGLQIAAGQTITVIAIAFGNEVIIFQSIERQVEVRNGDLLECHDFTRFRTDHILGISGQGQRHGYRIGTGLLAGNAYVCFFRKRHGGQHTQHHDDHQKQT